MQGLLTIYRLDVGPLLTKGLGFVLGQGVCGAAGFVRNASYVTILQSCVSASLSFDKRAVLFVLLSDIGIRSMTSWLGWNPWLLVSLKTGQDSLQPTAVNQRTSDYLGTHPSSQPPRFPYRYLCTDTGLGSWLSTISDFVRLDS